MTWWDDLWLNESFAEYMGYRTTQRRDEFDDVWVEFAFSTKAWGLAADQRSSSHPIAGNGAQDAQQALTDFDGISYSKGAAALRQLNAYLGEEAFIAGVVDHLRLTRTATPGSPTCSTRGTAPATSDVPAWAAAWLRTEGSTPSARQVRHGPGWWRSAVRTGHRSRSSVPTPSRVDGVRRRRAATARPAARRRLRDRDVRPAGPGGPGAAGLRRRHLGQDRARRRVAGPSAELLPKIDDPVRAPSSGAPCAKACSTPASTRRPTCRPSSLRSPLDVTSL